MLDSNENATNRLLDVLRNQGNKARKEAHTSSESASQVKQETPEPAPPQAPPKKKEKPKDHVLDFILGEAASSTDQTQSEESPVTETVEKPDKATAQTAVEIEKQTEPEPSVELTEENDSESDATSEHSDNADDNDDLMFLSDQEEIPKEAEEFEEEAEPEPDDGEEYTLSFVEDDEDQKSKESEDSETETSRDQAKPANKEFPKNEPVLEEEISLSPQDETVSEVQKPGESEATKNQEKVETEDQTSSDLDFDVDALADSLNSTKKKETPVGSTDFDFTPIKEQEPEPATETESKKEEESKPAPESEPTESDGDDPAKLIEKEIPDDTSSNTTEEAEKEKPEPEKPVETENKAEVETPDIIPADTVADEEEDLFGGIDLGSPLAHATEDAEPEKEKEEPESVATETVEDELAEREEEVSTETTPDDEEDFSDFDDDLENQGAVSFVYQKEKRFSLKYLKSKFRTSHSRIGLDIGTYAIKYIVANDTSGEITIEDFGYFKIPSTIRGNDKETETFIKSTIKKIVSNSELKKTRLNLLISGSDIGIKNIQMPKVGKKELQEAVRWSTKKHLSFSADESVLDFKVLKETIVDGVPKLDILVVAALETLVEKQVNLLSGLKTPTKILPTPLAMWRYYIGHYPTENLQNVMVIDIGHSTTMINVIHDENLRFAREIGVSGKDLTEALIGSMTTSSGERVNVEEDQAELFKMKYGFPLKEFEHRNSDEDIPLVQISSRLRAPIEKLANEIQRSIQYYAKEFSFGPIDKIYLCGGTAAMMNLVDFLSDYLNLDIQVSDPLNLWTIGKSLANIDVLEENSTSLATPAGISIDTTPDLNLLPEKYIQESQTKTIKTVFRLFLVVALAVVIGLSTSVSMKGRTLNSELDALKKQSSQMSPIEKDVIELQSTKQDAQKKVTALKKMINEPTFNIEFLRILSNVLPESVSLESVENIEQIRSSKQARIKLAGYIETTKYDANVKLAELVMLLQNSGYMTNVTLDNSQPVDSKDFIGMRFEISCRISGYEN